jgi:tRNA G46 methylase TrmB
MTESVAGQPAGRIERALAYSTSMARSLSRLALHRIRRTPEVVNDDYNLTHWKKMLSGQKWLASKGLDEFLLPAEDGAVLRKVAGKIVRISGHAYYSYRTAALGDLIKRYAGGDTHIVELGAGYGHNLCSLHLSHPNWTFEGFEIASNGVAAGREIARHFGLSNIIAMDRIDLTDASDANFAKIAGKTVFTYFCIEQITHDVAKVVENIMAAKPRRVINIEPTTELLDLTKPRDLVSFAYIKSVDYQTRLFTTLDRLEQLGRIRIVARERMQFAPTINNDGFLCCWEIAD